MNNKNDLITKKQLKRKKGFLNENINLDNSTKKYIDYIIQKINSKKVKDSLKYLQKNNNFFITPHIDGSTLEGRIKRSKFLINLLLKSLEKKNNIYLVTK